jgi:hypothetical protein
MRCVAIGAIHGGKRSRGFTEKVTVVGTCGQVSSGSVKKITTKVKKNKILRVQAHGQINRNLLTK